MSFKRFRRQGLVALLAVLTGCTVACSRFLNEKRQEPQTLEMSNTRFACLQSLPVEMTQFLKGEVSSADIRGGFDCAKNALVYFKNKTKGTYPEAYTLEDLRNFFGKYFLKKNNVSPAFAGELFKLKKVLLGGSDRTLTKNEIQKLVELLEVLKQQTVLVAPHVTLLLGERKNPTPNEVRSGVAQLRKSLWKVLTEVDLVAVNYSFEDLQRFMEGLDAFINATEPFYLSQKLSDNVPLVAAVKNVLVGETASLDHLAHWKTSFDTVLAVYEVGLQYRYFLHGKSLDHPERLAILMSLAHESFDLLEKSLPFRNLGGIEFAALDSVLDQMAQRNFLPTGVSAEALKTTYKKVVLRMLDPQRRGDVRGLRALERSHLLALRHELKVFQIHQQFIDSLPFDRAGNVSLPELRQKVTEFDAMAGIRHHFSQDSLEQEGLFAAWNEGRVLLTSRQPIFYNSQGRVVITPEPALFPQSWHSLTKWNLMRGLTRFLLLGYGANSGVSLLSQEMSEASLSQWYADFNTLGLQLKAFDPRSRNAGSRSFKEANFFTYQGNGDSRMSFFESFEFVSLLFAGGMSSAETLRQDLLKAGCGLSEKDVFGHPWLQERCFKNRLRSQFARFFDNLPGLVREVNGLSPAQWDAFYTTLMTAARVSPASGRKVETADVRAAVMLLHYTESLVSTFDRDGNGTLSVAEVRLAAPRFLQFMKQVSPIDSHFVVTDFFLYLVYKGKKPSLLEYGYFQAEKAFGSLEDVGRAKVLQVFKVLKDEASE